MNVLCFSFTGSYVQYFKGGSLLQLFSRKMCFELYCCLICNIYIYIYIHIHTHTHTHTQGVPGGMCQTSGECSVR